MTIGELMNRLAELVAEDPRNIAAPVTFGPAMEPVAGGIIAYRDGGAVLNLAPMTLDKIGGF